MDGRAVEQVADASHGILETIFFNVTAVAEGAVDLAGFGSPQVTVPVQQADIGFGIPGDGQQGGGILVHVDGRQHQHVGIIALALLIALGAVVPANEEDIDHIVVYANVFLHQFAGVPVYHGHGGLFRQVGKGGTGVAEDPLDDRYRRNPYRCGGNDQGDHYAQ